MFEEVQRTLQISDLRLNLKNLQFAIWNLKLLDSLNINFNEGETEGYNQRACHESD
jgi:hypothetical protein